MNSIKTSLLVFFCALNTWAAPEVLALRGKVYWNDKPVAINARLEGKGTLKTDEASSVILKWDVQESELRVAGDSELTWDNLMSPELVRGKVLCHIRKPKAATAPTDDLKTSRFTLRTSVAAMGVRGTKFLGVSTPLLNEAEIVVFEGVIDFRSTQDIADGRTITEGHWGGIGGRFGVKTAPPIKLSSAILQGFLDSKDFKNTQ